MRAILLNDTRSAAHVGCELVMANSLAECARVGLEIERLYTTADCRDSLIERLDSDRFDCLLINGEGSMHHDRPVPTHLCEAARWAKEQGKRTVLYNSLWEGNEMLNAFLPHFDRIFARDSRSGEAIRAAGGQCEVVPDMVFATQFGAFPSSKREGRGRDNEIVVTDSIDRKKSVRLSKFATYHGVPFLHMDRIGFERIKKKLLVRTGWYEGESDHLVTGFLEIFRSGRRVLSGRFHGTCLAMALGLPVVSVASNTAKLQALYHDVGLDPHLVRETVPRRLEELDEAFEQVESEAQRVRAYVDEARSLIRKMFDEIAGL